MIVILAQIKRFLLLNNNTKQIVVKNGFWLFCSELFSKGALFVMSILIARYLSTAGFGVFSFAFAFVALFSTLADFGLSTLAVRELAKDKTLSEKYINNIITLKIVLSILTACLIYTVAKILLRDDTSQLLIYLGGIYVITNSFSDFLRSVFRAYEKMEYEAISKVVQGFILITLGVALITLKVSIDWIMSAYISAALSSLLLTLVIVHKRFSRIKLSANFTFWKKLIRDTWPLGLAMLSVILYQNLTKVMLGFLDTVTAVGIYNAGYRIIEIPIILAALLSQSLFPRLSYLYRHTPSRFRNVVNQITLGYTIIPLVIATAIFFFSRNIVLLLFGQQYSQSIPVLRLLTIILIPVFLNNLYGNIAIIRDKQNIFLYAVLVGLFGNLLFNSILIPRYSYIGATIAIIIAESLSALFLFVYLLTSNRKTIAEAGRM